MMQSGEARQKEVIAVRMILFMDLAPVPAYLSYEDTAVDVAKGTAGAAPVGVNKCELIESCFR